MTATPAHILLLTGNREAPHFSQFLTDRNPRLTVSHATTLARAEQALANRLAETRIIAFLTDIIVPGSVLSKLGPTPYNIHPGPPEYPGSYPESFAIWDQATTYGITAHEMAARVDTGRIVAVSRFALPDQPDLSNVGDLIFAQAVEMFATIGAHCANSNAPLPTSGDQWHDRRYTKADFQTLCRSGHGLAPTDLARLKRACGQDFVPPG
ncbi:MAG: formyltransferase family protein [Pseudomonadota bacterium]